jgi:hypothetical protein
VGGKRNAYNVFVGKPERKKKIHLEVLSVDVRIILR